jgi:hypothetical protein
MTAEQQPQFVERETSAGSAGASRLAGDEPHEFELGKDASHLSENQKLGPDLGPEADSEQRKLFNNLKEQLHAEWKPTGVSEDLAVLELTLLYFQRGCILDLYKAEKSERRNENSLEDMEKLSPEQKEEADVQRLLQVGLRSTPQEAMEKRFAHLDQ